MIDEKLQAGIAAAKTGDKDHARNLLTQVVEADETHVSAWLWLAYIIDDLDEKEVCFENVLALDPKNSIAHKGLIWLAKARAKKRKPAVEMPTLPLEDEFDNEWLCPYCAKLTDPADENCPHCGEQLALKKRLSPERSVWLWRGFYLQLYTAFYAIAAMTGYFSFAGTLQKIENPFVFLPLYFGKSVAQSQGSVAHILSILPIWVFWMVVAVATYALIMMILLYIRVPFGHLMYVLNVGLTLVASLIGVVFAPVDWLRIVGGAGIALALLQLLIALNLWKDFTFKEIRLRFQVDSDAKNASSLYFAARRYAEKNLRGLTVLHLRRCVAKASTNSGYWIALTVAYLNIHRIELARKSLAEAQKLNADANQVRQLHAQIVQLEHDGVISKKVQSPKSKIPSLKSEV